MQSDRGVDAVFTEKAIFIIVLVAVEAYLLGSMNSAIIISRLLRGDDIRRHGSGNAGMTNMLRTYGKGPAVWTAVGDFLKAVAAVLLARLAFWMADLSIPIDAGYVAGLFVLLGHLFPVYFGFKGGKGVMTALGVILMTSPLAFLVVVVVFVPLIFATRIVSLGSVFGCVAFPFITWGIRRLQRREPLYDVICATIIALIILFMHRENIVRLLSGTENRFGKRSGGGKDADGE